MENENDQNAQIARIERQVALINQRIGGGGGIFFPYGSIFLIK